MSGGGRWNESSYQAIVSKRYQTDHSEITVGGADFGVALEQATWHMDLPIVHLGCVFLMRLCQHSVRKSKVVITGEGADELFGGYTRYKTDQQERFALQVSRLGFGNTLYKLPWFRQFQRKLSSVLDTHLFFEKAPLLACLDHPKVDVDHRLEAIGDSGSFYTRLLRYDQKCYLQSVLERQDKMSMAASVEARVPFCNPQLFDLVNGIPESLKITNQGPKHLLRKIAKTYLPAEVVDRRKIGLILPIGEWFRSGPLKDLLSLLTDNTARERGIYDTDHLRRVVDDHVQGRRDCKFLSNLVMFEVWMRLFIDGGGGAYPPVGPKS